MARQKIVKIFLDDREYSAVAEEAGDVPLSRFLRNRVLERIPVPVGVEPRKAVDIGAAVSTNSAAMPTAPKPLTTPADIVAENKRRKLRKFANLYCHEHHVMGCAHCAARHFDQGAPY